MLLEVFDRVSYTGLLHVGECRSELCRCAVCLRRLIFVND